MSMFSSSEAAPWALDDLIHLVVESKLLHDQEFDPTALGERAQETEAERAQKLVASLAFNRDQVIDVMRVAATYFDAIQLLIHDLEYRSKQGIKLYYPLDFSEIYSYMHSNLPGTRWGKTVEYFLLNNKSYVFTMLPATTFEFRSVAEMTSVLRFGAPDGSALRLAERLVGSPGIVSMGTLTVFDPSLTFTAPVRALTP